MKMDSIEELYKCYEVLSDAGEKIDKHEAEYKEILNAVRGSSKEKRLASQFIGKFFKHFPNLVNVAIDAQLNLCEDEDAQIRRQAIKSLPQFCKDTTEHTTRISEKLAQLLVLEDQLDLQQVCTALLAIVKIDSKGTLTGIFRQITSGDEVTRERCFKFIATKILPLGSEVITKEIELFIIDEIKTILQDVTADEFHLCMNILGSTRLGTTITGHAELVKLAMEQAELDVDIDPMTMEDEIIERFIQCSNHAVPYFSPQIKSTQFVSFVCDKLLPLNTWNMIAVAAHQDQVQLRLLKVFAEMSTYCGTLENASSKLDAVYSILREYMPLPKLDDDVLKSAPSFQFSHIECLLYSFLMIAKQNTTSLTFFNDQTKVKDFRARLQFLARGTQGYIKKLQEAVKDKTQEELKTEENQIKLTALKTTSNINLLIRDLFHSPPSFKTEIFLSWVTPKSTKLGAKRHIPITFGGSKTDNGKPTATGDVKKRRSSTEQKVYIPPSGKYSGKVRNYNVY